MFTYLNNKFSVYYMLMKKNLIAFEKMLNHRLIKRKTSKERVNK